MQSKRIEICVGMFMILGIAALVMLTLQVSNAGKGMVDTYELKARFTNVGGLNEKAPVMVGGVRIGRVSHIRIDKNDYNAVVTLLIDTQYDNIPIDTGAAILTSGLLGAQFIGLSPGADESFLEPGDTLAFTQSAIQLESLISQFMFNQGNGEQR